MSMGGGSQESSSSSYNDMNAASNSWMESAAQSMNQNNSYVDPMQQAYLNNMYSQALGAANPAQSTNAAYQAQGAMLPGLQQGYANLAALTDTKSQIADQRQSLRSGLGTLFEQEMMPALQSEAIGAGGFGGGREGVAQGVAAGQIADAYTQGLGDITSRAAQNAVGAASQLPAMGQAIYSAFTAPTMAGMDPLQRLSQILGGATVLNSGYGESTSGSSSQSQSEQTAGSGSDSDSSGYNFSLGLW